MLDKYSDTGPERCGFVVDNELIEVENVHPQPDKGFKMKSEDLIKYGDVAQASWHTHPGVGANLSTDDYLAFLNWPKLLHYVIGKDGQRCFIVVKGSIVET